MCIVKTRSQTKMLRESKIIAALYIFVYVFLSNIKYIPSLTTRYEALKNILSPALLGAIITYFSQAAK